MMAVSKDVELCYERDMALFCIPVTNYPQLITDHRRRQGYFWRRRRADIADIVSIMLGRSAPFFWHRLN